MTQVTLPALQKVEKGTAKKMSLQTTARKLVEGTVTTVHT